MADHPTLRFHDTMAGAVRPFEPIGTEATLYSCGPTVYHHAHLGNMRTYVFVDTLKRVTEAAGLPVKHVMNITDVGHLVSDADDGEDKMEVGAAREGLDAWAIAERYEQSFVAQCETLNISAPTILCRATDHIGQQIAMIEALEAKGYTYRIADGIYFDTEKLDDYGTLGGYKREGQRAGARVAEGEKRAPTDFALWKFSAEGVQRQMEWPSPWGVGFPGWHIECSAMAQHYLGETIDIHTGGIDHIPIHHANEIAQSECCSGETFVNYWMHGAFMEASEGVKMAKSSGDFLTIFDLVEKGIDPLAFRLLCFRTHYRKNMKFSWKLLDDSVTALRRLRLRVAGLAEEGGEETGAAEPVIAEGIATLADDLALPKTLVFLQTQLKSKVLSPADKLAVVDALDSVLQLNLRGRDRDADADQARASTAAWASAAAAGGHELGNVIRAEVAV
ncbi:MAG: cysteine--tRNA ligase [Pseudomonadota bacterium]